MNTLFLDLIQLDAMFICANKYVILSWQTPQEKSSKGRGVLPQHVKTLELECSNRHF